MKKAFVTPKIEWMKIDAQDIVICILIIPYYHKKVNRTARVSQAAPNNFLSCLNIFHLLRLIDDPDVCDPIKYLREREIVHYQRFGDALRITQDQLDSRNFYAFNPSFDKNGVKMKNI